MYMPAVVNLKNLKNSGIRSLQRSGFESRSSLNFLSSSGAVYFLWGSGDWWDFDGQFL